MKIAELKVRRAMSPEDILGVPSALLRQVDGLDVDMVYKNAEALASSPNVWIILLTDVTGYIRGILWFTIDVFEKQLFVYLFAVDPEYQSCDLNHARWVGEFLFNLVTIPEQYRRKIQWLTDRPKLYERFGVKRAQRVMLEIYREDYERAVEIASVRCTS